MILLKNAVFWPFWGLILVVNYINKILVNLCCNGFVIFYLNKLSNCGNLNQLVSWIMMLTAEIAKIICRQFLTWLWVFPSTFHVVPYALVSSKLHAISRCSNPHLGRVEPVSVSAHPVVLWMRRNDVRTVLITPSGPMRERDGGIKKV